METIEAGENIAVLDWDFTPQATLSIDDTIQFLHGWRTIDGRVLSTVFLKGDDEGGDDVAVFRQRYLKSGAKATRKVLDLISPHLTTVQIAAFMTKWGSLFPSKGNYSACLSFRERDIAEIGSWTERKLGHEVCVRPGGENVNQPRWLSQLQGAFVMKLYRDKSPIARCIGLQTSPTLTKTSDLSTLKVFLTNPYYRDCPESAYWFIRALRQLVGDDQASYITVNRRPLAWKHYYWNGVTHEFNGASWMFLPNSALDYCGGCGDTSTLRVSYGAPMCGECAGPYCEECNEDGDHTHCPGCGVDGGCRCSECSGCGVVLEEGA